jgi:type III pantothenate kinase
MNMVVLIDIGNSNIVITKYDGDYGRTYRYNTDKTKSIDEYFVLLKDIISDANDIVISSVVPELNVIIKNVALTYLNINPIFVGPGVKTGVQVKTDNPKEVGTDLVCSAAAVIEHYGSDAIVIDMGTATTFTMIENKVIKGISITTGLVTQKNALVGNASQLSQFEFKTPNKVLGTNTIDSLNSGLLYGNSLMLQGMIEEIKKLFKTAPKVVVTGGASRFIKDLMPKEIIFDEILLLKGLLAIYNKNN